MLSTTSFPRNPRHRNRSRAAEDGARALGAVNLRAEEEQAELTEKLNNLIRERDDVIDAIRKLRSAIQNLNREGRDRLMVAFDAVNLQFKRLFTHLFNGGEAELQLIESDDPLEAGLEILARRPARSRRP